MNMVSLLNAKRQHCYRPPFVVVIIVAEAVLNLGVLCCVDSSSKLFIYMVGSEHSIPVMQGTSIQTSL